MWVWTVVPVLQRYPLDTQQCNMTLFLTSGKTAELSWANVIKGKTMKFNLGSFALDGHSAVNCPSEVANCLRIVFTLKRQMGYFLMQVCVLCLVTK